LTINSDCPLSAIVVEIPALKRDQYKLSNGIGLRLETGPLAHNLPTTRDGLDIQDPDLAQIVCMWDRLTDDAKRQIMAIIEANAG
jgi:hypothetical protein